VIHDDPLEVMMLTATVASDRIHEHHHGVAIEHDGVTVVNEHGMAIVRPEQETLSRQRLPFFLGVSAASTGSTGISMNLVVIPPHSAAEPHSHRGFETAVFMMKGGVDVRYGPALESHLRLDEGDFLFIPANLPHQPVNVGDEPVYCIVARNDANEQESVELFVADQSDGTPDRLCPRRRSILSRLTRRCG
jgi:uncharacterized RmlC-like cupin family protein